MKLFKPRALPINSLVAGAITLACVCWCGAGWAAASASRDASAAKSPAARVDDKSQQQLVYDVNTLRGILVVPQLKDVNVNGVTGVKGVQIKGPSFLQNREMTRLLSHYLNAPLTKAALSQMQVDIIKYCRAKGHLVVDVFLEEQAVKEGTIQVAVIEAKIGSITVTNAHWFSKKLILGDLHLRPGDTVEAGTLDRDLSWLNRNTYQSLGYFDGTFREVTASFQQGDLGQTDLKLNVQDRLPVRVFAGYDDAGVKVVGDDRYFAGATWANAFGLDQRLNYQYIADTSFKELQEHVASYVIPLPWHHELTFLGAYANLDPDLSTYGPAFAHFHNSGTYYQLSGRYTIPLPQSQNYDQEIMLGIDYKNTDTPLLFGASSSSPLSTNNFSVFQFLLGYTGVLKDKWGNTSLSIQGVYSPGDLVDNDNKAAYFDTTRDPNISSTYAYGRLELRRETTLPCKFSWYLHAMGQLSDADLLPTETFGLGGYDTVRGYDERAVSGDNGWLIVNELRTPRLRLGNITRQKGQFDWIQGLIFCDYGGVDSRNPAQGYASTEQLLSVGAGVRFQVADNMCVRFDYGVELDRDYTSQASIFFKNEPVSRMHLGVELSY